MNLADNSTRMLLAKAAAAIHVWTIHTMANMEDGPLTSSVEDKLRYLRSALVDTDTSWNDLDSVWETFMAYTHFRCHLAPAGTKKIASIPFDDDPVEGFLTRVERGRPGEMLAQDLLDSIPIETTFDFVAEHLLRQIEEPSLRSLGQTIRRIEWGGSVWDQLLEVDLQGLECREYGITIDLQIRPSRYIKRISSLAFNDLDIGFRIGGDKGTTFPSSIASARIQLEEGILRTYKATLATLAKPVHRLKNVAIVYDLKTGKSDMLLVELPPRTP